MITIEPPQSLSGSGLPGVTRPAVARFLVQAKKAIGLQGDVHVLLADDVTLKRLNKTFRGKDKPTDVLSFPAGPSTVFFNEPDGAELAGDLAISLETAARQAVRFGHTLAEEIRILLIHGLLHLAGFDHETDSGEMSARETDLRQQFGLPAGLIARTTKAAPQKVPGKASALRRARA
jgi:probable rRNA maturation factor